jgi:ribonuclease Z
MRVKVGDIWQMEKFTPALLKLLAEEEKAPELSLEEQSKRSSQQKRSKAKRNN